MSDVIGPARSDRRARAEINAPRWRSLLAVVLTGFLGVGLVTRTAHAASLTPSCEDLSTGGSSCVGVIPSTLVDGPGYLIGNSFTSSVGNTVIYTGGPGFVDAYLFSVGPSSADVLTATINLGGADVINGLSVRIYDLGTNPVDSYSSSAGLVLPDDTPSPFYVNGSSTSSGGITTAVIDPVTLSAGSYALEVWGTVAGSQGGSYSGTLQLSPVPLPATLPLTLSGLALLSLVALRRRNLKG
jgi:hypothetical protein